MFTFIDLFKLYGTEIPYRKLLITVEWKSKRRIIIKRDNKTCQVCNKIGTGYYEIEETVEEAPFILNGQDTGTIKMILKKELVKISNPTFIHVHHKYYIKDKFPWEYSDDALITVCSDCHKKIHTSEKIPFYTDNSMSDDLGLTPCYRCEGVGEFPEFKHVQNGICFRCGGAKYENLIREIDRIQDAF